MISKILILLFISVVLILFLPINFFLEYDSFHDIAEVSFLCFKFDTSNKKNLKAIEKSTYNEIGKLKHLKKILESKNEIFNLIKLFIICAKILFKNAKIDKFKLKLGVSGNEAFECARNFCVISSLISLLKNSLDLESRVKDLEIAIYPLFLSEKFSLEAELKIRFCIAKLIFCILIIIFKHARVRVSDAGIVQR